jgi:Zn-dependent protease
MTGETVPVRRPGPWDAPEGEALVAAPPPQASRLKSLAWGVISTALLAGWLTWAMGWVWALAGVVGVFVHEYGHVLAMNRLGCGPGRIQIIPFLGGAAIPARAPSTEYRGVLISLAGPAFGLLATLPFFAAYAATGQAMWMDGALFICLINLINLAPAPPLDGSKALGPALARIHPLVERGVMVAIGAAVALWAVSRGSYIFGAFVALAIFGSLRAPRLRPLAEKLTGQQQLGSAGLYLAVAALCFAALELVVFTAGSGSHGLTVLRRVLGT